jgi:hypothetical protein
MDSGRRRFVALPPIAGDTLLTLLAIAYAILHLMVTRRHGPAADDSWAFVLAVLCAASLLGRSRWPLGTLLAVGGFGALYLKAEPDLFPILPAVLIALCSAVAYSRRPRWQVWSVAIGVAALLNLVRITSDFVLSLSVTGFLLDM